jgi:signal transduction histidine kinase
MNRPRHIWVVFGLCFALLLAAMAWVSATSMRLERGQQRAAQQAEIEERVRLALWRMDASLATLIVEESARPWQAYNSFAAAERAYTKSFTAIKQGEVLVPSRLLTARPTNVLIHFQFTEEGRLTSPQVPLGNERDLAEASYTTRDRIEADARRLAELENILNQQASAGQTPVRNAWTSLTDGMSSSSLRSRKSTSVAPTAMLNRDVLLNTCAPSPTNISLPAFTASTPLAGNASRLNYQNQLLRNNAEQNARASAWAQQAYNGEAQQQRALPANAVLGMNEGPLVAAWVGPALVLARRVNGEGRTIIQGAWIDWDPLKQSLLGSVRDLFPSAELQPVANSLNSDSRRLAALPARLVTGPLPEEPLAFWSPVRFMLAVAWGAVLLAGIAVAVLLNGAISLSERRGAFVSAVTHELRTPLTTFKMYSEMLADGMVRDESQRKSYLTTLCSEANRLSHLVENVLAYARLERGSARSRVERVTLGQLIARTQERLQQRAEQAGMQLVVDASEDAAETLVHVDVAAVEQILFNLVDNACKYAAPSTTEKIIHLEALPDGKFAMLRVRDHGRGISDDGAKRLFQPFSKSAHEAAHSAPGIGLGLALCRRLSRSIGGDLRLNRSVTSGACFELILPRTGDSAAALASI